MKKRPKPPHCSPLPKRKPPKPPQPDPNSSTQKRKANRLKANHVQQSNIS